jgi:hypothetical protein
MTLAYEKGRLDALLTIQEAIQREFPSSEIPWYVERSEVLAVLRRISEVTKDDNWKDTDRLDRVLARQMSHITENFPIL